MTFYSDLAETAADMLTEFGQVVTLRRTTPGGYDPTTGTNRGGSDGFQEVRAVETSSRVQAINGVLVQAGDKVVMTSPVDTSGASLDQPQPEDGCAFADAEWTVKAVEPMSPGGVVLGYTLLLRK